jgi:hypothetical protein
MALLEHPNNDDHEAALSRSFFIKPRELTEANPLFVQEVVRAQAAIALNALESLEKYRRELAVGELATTSLVSDKRLDKVRTRTQDYGSVWRRSFDTVSHNIALAMPHSRLTSGIFAEGVFYTDETKICLVTENEERFAFYSLLTQMEFNNGMRMATTEMQEQFMAAVVSS